MSEPVISESVDVFREIRRCYRLSLDLQKEAKAAEESYIETIETEAKKFKDRNEKNYAKVMSNESVGQSRNELENVICKLMTLRNYVEILEPMMLQENLTDVAKNKINEKWNEYCSADERVSERWQKLKSEKEEEEEESISDFFSDEKNEEIPNEEIPNEQKNDLKIEYEELISEFGNSECDNFFKLLMQQVKRNKITDNEKDINELEKNYGSISNFNIQEKRGFLNSIFNFKVITSENVLDTFELMLRNNSGLYSSKVSHDYVNYNIEEKSLNGKNELNKIAENAFFPDTYFTDIPLQNIGSSRMDGSCLLGAIFPYLTQEIMDKIVDYVQKNDTLCPTIYNGNTQAIFKNDGVTTFFDLVIKNRTYYDKKGNFQSIDNEFNLNYVWYMRAAIALYMYETILEDKTNKEKKVNSEIKDVLGITNGGYIEANASVMDALANLTGYSIVAITNQNQPGDLPSYANSSNEYIRLNYSVPNNLKGKCYKENITNYNDDLENLGEIQINQANNRAKMAINDFTYTLINGNKNDNVEPINEGEKSVIEPAKYKIDENTVQKIIFVRKGYIHYEPVQPNGLKHHELMEKQFKSVDLPQKQEDFFNYLRNKENIEFAPKDVSQEMSNLLSRKDLPISPIESAKYLLYGINQNAVLLNYFRQVTKSKYEKKIDEFKTTWNDKLNEMQKNLEKEFAKSKEEVLKAKFKSIEKKDSFINNLRDNYINRIMFINFLRYFIMQKYFYEMEIENEFEKFCSELSLNQEQEIKFNLLISENENEYGNFKKSFDVLKNVIKKLKSNEMDEENSEIKKRIKKNYEQSISECKNICDAMKMDYGIKIDDNLIKKNQSVGISSFFLSVLSYITPKEFNLIRKYVDEKNQEVKINGKQRTVLDWLNDSKENLLTPEIYLRAYVVLKCLERFPNDNKRDKNLNSNLRTILGCERDKNIDWTNFAFFKLVSQTLEKSILIVSPGTDKDKSGYCCVKSKNEKIEIDESAKKLSDFSSTEIVNADKKINNTCNNFSENGCICIHYSDENNFAPIGYDLDINKFGSMILSIDDGVALKNIKLLANNFLETLHVNLSSKFLKTTESVIAMALLSKNLKQNDISLLKKWFTDDNNNFLESKFEKFANIMLKNIRNPFQTSSFNILVLANLFSKGIHFSSDLNSKLFQIEPIEKFLPSDMYYEFLNNFLKIDKESQENIINLLINYKENTQYVLPLVCDLINNKFDESIYKNSVNLLEEKENFNFYISNRKSIEEKNYKFILRLNIDENLKSDFIKKIHFLSLEELNLLEKIILNSGQNATALLKLSIKDFQDVTKELMKWKNFLRLNKFSERQIGNMENEFIKEKFNVKNFDVKKFLIEIHMMQKNYLLISSKDKRDYYSNPIEYVENFQKDLKKIKEMLQKPIGNFEKLFDLCDDKVLVDKCLTALESEKTNESIDFAEKLKAIIEIKKSLCRVRSWHRDTAKVFITNVFGSYVSNNPFDYDSFISNLEDFIEQYRKNPRGFAEIIQMRNNLDKVNYKSYPAIYDLRLNSISKKFTELTNDEALILFYLCIRTFTKNEVKQKTSFAEKINKTIEQRNVLQPSLQSSTDQSLTEHN